MKKVHFVCIGNCCRSQMAEGFANHYGKDVLVATSSGLAPTRTVAQETIDTMRLKDVDISHHFPKVFLPLEAASMDLIVNISGYNLPGKLTIPVEHWDVDDPYGGSPELYLEVANTLEVNVMTLIQKLRQSEKD